MSRWRIAVKALHEHGPMTARQLDRLVGGSVAATESGLYQAAGLGLVNSPGRGGQPKPWTLTDKGRAWAEGRLAVVAGQHNKPTWRATWLASLPQMSLSEAA